MILGVFISSTFGDFLEERKKLIANLPLIQILPICAECQGYCNFPTTEDYLKSWIDRANAVVLLIGLRYGSTSDDGISWTEKEIDYALGQGKKVFAYFRQHPGWDSSKIQIPKQLQEFKEKIENLDKNVPRYDDGDLCKLIAMVIRDLDRWSQELITDEQTNTRISSDSDSGVPDED